MKRHIFTLIQFTFLFFVVSCSSLIKFRSGIKDLNYLREVRDVNVIFDYSDMAVGKYDDEDEYVADKVLEKNEKEPGEGDDWKEKWFGQRERVFEPSFLDELNKLTTNKMDLNFSKENEDAPYTVVVHTFFMEPGFDVGVVSKDAEIDATITVYKSNNLSEPLSTFDAYDIQGSNTSGMYGPSSIDGFSVSGRLGDAYRRCGEEFAEYIDENME